MSDQLQKEQTPENVTELTDGQLEEAAGGELCTVDAVPSATLRKVDDTEGDLATAQKDERRSEDACFKPPG